jgi:hypothetical protein
MEGLPVFKTIKRYILILLLAYGVYFVLDHHFLFEGSKFYLLKKSELSLKYTFFNMTDRRVESVMKIDELRNDGVGDLLVELGKITEEEKIMFEKKFSEKAR